MLPTMTMSESGAASIQPKPNEQALLTSIMPAMTAVRPHRSDSAPPAAEATIPMMWKTADSEAPRPAARSTVVPSKASAAATKAGVHAHMPRSSQE